MDDIIQKIKKALALAHGNSNAEEAHTAILLVQRLMVKHNLSMSDIPLDKQKEKKTGRGYMNMGRVEWWQRRLSVIVADNFRCHSFYNSGNYVGFIGLEEDAKIAIEIFRFASEAIKFHSAKYLRENKERRSRKYAIAIKNDYIKGFLNGLKDKFKEQVESESLAIVLVKDAIVVRAVEDMKLKKGSPIRNTTANDGEALRQGYRDGKRFEKPVGQIGGV